jgi:hypothetical protein
MEDQMTEREMEDLLWTFPDKFLNEPLTQFRRQPVSQVGRADLVFKDRLGRLLVLSHDRNDRVTGHGISVRILQPQLAMHPPGFWGVYFGPYICRRHAASAYGFCGSLGAPGTFIVR